MTTFSMPRSQRLLQGLVHALIAVLVMGCAVGSPPARSSGPQGEDSPPARVGKVGLLSGPVTLIDLQTGEQQAASLNWPITSGHRLSTGALARAEVRIGSLALRLDGDTEVDFPRIDDDVIQIAVLRGSVALRARNREILPEIDLMTTRERIVLDDVGRYRLDVDRAAGITSLTAFVGSARIATGRMTFSVRSGQRGEIGNAPGTGFTLVGPAMDIFDDWVASRDRRDDNLASTRYVSPETTGVETLDHYGAWRSVPEYGPVWFPHSVPSGWAPYRHGRWAYVSPWGWTWIDEAPWGFAPFHYGRWALVGGAWCWVPGAWVARPVYAPALVAWYGAPGVSVSIGYGAVGWFPLGPREVYVPPYRHGRRYITGVNIGHVGSIDYGRVNPPPRYVHQDPRASTWVPNDAIARREPIKRVVTAPPADSTQFVARPAPPAALDSIKRRFEPAAGDAVRPTPRGGFGGNDAPVRAQPGPTMPAAPVAPGAPQVSPGGKLIAPAPQPVPPAAMPGRDPRFDRVPERGNERGNERGTDRNDRGSEFVRPMPRTIDEAPGRRSGEMPAIPAPRPEVQRPDFARPVPPPVRSEPPRIEGPSPKFERVAPPPRMDPPRVDAPRMEPPQVRPMPAPEVRTPPPRSMEPPTAPAPRAEPPRAEPPRGGGKFVRERDQ